MEIVPSREGDANRKRGRWSYRRIGVGRIRVSRTPTKVPLIACLRFERMSSIDRNQLADSQTAETCHTWPLGRTEFRSRMNRFSLKMQISTIDSEAKSYQYN